MLFYYLLLFVYSLSPVFILPCASRSCSHKPPTIDEVTHVSLEPHHVLRKRSTYEPLRIKVHYDQSVRNLPPEKLAVINNTVLPQALDYWRRALLVKPLSVPIRLNRKCANNKAFFSQSSGLIQQFCVERCELITTCGEVIVPETHLEVCRYCTTDRKHCDSEEPRVKSEGITDADFVFYISATQTERCNKGATVAYAAHCQQEAAMDRPIAGHANLCPDSISTKPQDLETLLSTVKHEILHALGFSLSLYAYFRDSEGKPLTPRGGSGKPLVKDATRGTYWGENVITRVIRHSWKVRSGLIKKEIHVISTPRVVQEVRDHFNCPDLEGAELEDQGEDGTILTHWEKRVFENEAMTGTHTQNPVYSRITLALMEDTGWYKPNYSLAQPLKWGRGLGCDFSMKSCKDWIDSKRLKNDSIHPFCDKVKRDPLVTECTDSRDAVALCNLMEYPKELPAEFQNFDSIPGVKGSKETARYGGSVNLADYCPYIQEFTWKSNDVIVRGSQCQFTENNPSAEKNFALESYGVSSKCFNHYNQWEERTCSQVRQWQHWGSGCYEYSCNEGRLSLVVANHTFTCLYKGQELRIQLYANDWLHTGTIVCPSCHSICSSQASFKCKADVKTVRTSDQIKYHRDFLKCPNATSKCIHSNLTMTIVILIAVTFTTNFRFTTNFHKKP